jgi:hypothetical protein
MEPLERTLVLGAHRKSRLAFRPIGNWPAHACCTQILTELIAGTRKRAAGNVAITDPSESVSSAKKILPSRSAIAVSYVREGGLGDTVDESQKKHHLLIKEMAAASQDKLNENIWLHRNAVPTKITGRRVRQASDTRKEKSRSRQLKKSCLDASRSASAISFIYRGTFLHGLRTSQFRRRCKDSFFNHEC